MEGKSGAKKRARKPRPFRLNNWNIGTVRETFFEKRRYAGLSMCTLNKPQEARRLAKWLLEFADWAEGKEPRK